MNPSSAGWIHKFLKDFSREKLVGRYPNSEKFYDALRETGFLYGVSVRTLMDKPVSQLKLTQDELTKLNLFHALSYSYFRRHPRAKEEAMIDTVITFYKSVEKGKRSFLKKYIFTSSASENLENILAARMQESNSLLKNESASLITYALLYVDILAFVHYLNNPSGLKSYMEALEQLLIECSILALKAKEHKNKYDNLVIDMVVSSSEFMMTNSSPKDINTLLGVKLSELERRFILDICCLAVWDDQELDSSEYRFLQEVASKLRFSKEYLDQCVQHLIQFSEENATKIKLYEYTHPVKLFYKQSTDTVKLLILRNKNRLIKELEESGELLVLLSQSTIRDLSSEEKTKVKDQLLDIFKTIPSLTIFMLPGGALLLPLFVKLIPKLLPSAFQENRVEEKK